MYKQLIVFLSLVVSYSGYSQTTKPVRYHDLVYSEVIIQKNNSYSSNQPKKKSYLFDIYEPSGDSSLQRPLIIWLHGGGFTFGSKNAPDIQLWCEDFAKRGYVCVAINYRLNKMITLVDFTEFKRGCYKGVLDLENAVNWFKKNRASLRIDTNRIILAGNSAGGMIALQAVYSSNKELGNIARLPGADNFSTSHNAANISAVVNFWGALFSINWLKNAKIPIVSVHGTNDKVVPFDHRDTSLYGSYAIHKKANELKIPNRLKIYTGYSHELQKKFNPLFAGKETKKRWLEAGQFVADFLYEQLFQK